MVLRRIRHAEQLEGLKLRLDYDDNTSVVADFEPLIDRGGMFERLRAPDYFSRFVIARGGRALEWPDGLDFCADALWIEGHPAAQRVASATKS